MRGAWRTWVELAGITVTLVIIVIPAAAGSTSATTGAMAHSVVLTGTVKAKHDDASAGGFDGFTQMTPGYWTVGQDYGGWIPVFNGYGSIGVTADPTVGNVLELSPEVAKEPSETHSALVTTAATQSDFDISVKVQTISQLRIGSAPNPWEVGWVLWHYTNNAHFYYFILKPNGWELGKEDPVYPGNQRFLVTGSSPTAAVGSWHTISVRQVGATMTVSVNAKRVVTFTDMERPYANGSYGLYCEDSVVNFADPRIISLPGGRETAGSGGR